MPESWIKVHTDMLHDPKILRLHPVSRYAWIGLLLMCRTGRPPGTWKAPSRDSAAADLTLALGLDDPLDNDSGPLVKGDFQRMLDSGMVTICHDGLVTVTHWAERQGDLNPSSAPERTRERKRAQRDREMSRPVTTGHDRGEEKRVEEKRKIKSNSVRPRAALDTPRFDEFWKAYPKKRSKGDALKAWSALKPTAGMAEQILASLTRLKLCHDWVKESGKYVPYPASWLRAMGWEDVVEVSAEESAEDVAEAAFLARRAVKP